MRGCGFTAVASRFHAVVGVKVPSRSGLGAGARGDDAGMYNDLDLRTSVARAAAQADLGSHRATYVAVEASTRRLVIEAVGVLISGAVTLIGFSTGAEVLGIIGLTVMLMVGGRLLFDLLRLWFVSSRNRSARLDMYEHGLVVIVRGAPRTIRYDSTVLKRSIVQLVRNPAPEQVSYSHSLTDSLGVPIVLRQAIAHPERWGAVIDRAVTAAQLPRSIAVLDAGGRLDFEHFWMSAAEIGAGKRSAAWSRVSDIEVSKGWVSIHVTGGAKPLESLPVSLIPNFTVFLKLAERMAVNVASR